MVQRLDHLKGSQSETASPYVPIGTNTDRVEITGVWREDIGLVIVDTDTDTKCDGETMFLDM